MFYALNNDGMKIDACNADIADEYRCPICKNPVVLKRGMVNIAHFAHEANVCDDYWNYDMSLWHRRMQSYFPVEAREVVVHHKGIKHRADVLIGNIVLEFQFSPITASEFDERNHFFKNAGYKLAWIFNLSHIPEGNLYASDEKPNMMIWKHPMRIFANVEYINDKNKKFAIWFSYGGDNDFEELGEECLEKVVWAIKDDGCYSMRRFFTSNYCIAMSEKEPINPERFFYSEDDFAEEEKMLFKKELAELKSKHAYYVRYKGKKGEPKQAYICPRRKNIFGLNLTGESGCYHCKYCYMVARTTNEYGNMFASYCCFPEQVRETNGDNSCYECSQVDIFDI